MYIGYICKTKKIMAKKNLTLNRCLRTYPRPLTYSRFIKDYEENKSEKESVSGYLEYIIEKHLDAKNKK
jgi:hypothetical protein